MGGNPSDGKALFMRQGGNSAISYATTFPVNATKQKPDRVWIAARGDIKPICPELIDPARYLRRSLQSAVSVQA